MWMVEIARKKDVCLLLSGKGSAMVGVMLV